MLIFFNLLSGLFTLIQFIFVLYLISLLLLLIISKIIEKNDIVKYLKSRKKTDNDFDFAAIITVHQDASFILPFINSFLKQTYTKFIVYIIADDCDISSFSFNENRIKLIMPVQPIHSKVKSIRYAIDHFEREHNVLVIFDSDSLVHPLYFEKLNVYLQAGYSVVQTRESRMMLGLSSIVSVNGIAIKTNAYNEIVYVDSLEGFDKRLQSFLAKRLDQVAFANDAIFYEEKVNDGHSFETKWTRRIYSYFKDYWFVFFLGIKILTFNKFFFGLIAMRPPLFHTVGISLILMLVSLFIDPMYSLMFGILIFLFLFSFVLIALTKGYQKRVGSAIIYLPKIVLLHLKALLQIGKARKKYLKTEYSEFVYI